jgi:hypothetical protein
LFEENGEERLKLFSAMRKPNGEEGVEEFKSVKK